MIPEDEKCKRLGDVLGASWGVLGRPAWGVLGRVGALAGVLGAPWGRLGNVLGASWGRLGGVLGRLVGVLGASWGILGRLGASSGRLGRVLRVSWERLGASERKALKNKKWGKTVGFTVFARPQASQETFAQFSMRHKDVQETPLSAGGAPRRDHDEHAPTGKRAKPQKAFREARVSRERVAKRKSLLPIYIHPLPPTGRIW